MPAKRICIIGGGLAGLSAAYYLQQRKHECHVFERESRVGGLCRSRKSGAFTFDYSGHLLHFRHAGTFRLVSRLLKGNLLMHRRNAWVSVGAGFVRYPFQANFYGLPRRIARECLLEFIKARCAAGGSSVAQANLERWILRTFGKGIARHFLLPYNRKFWRVPVRSLTTDWLDGFIPVPSLKEVIEGSLSMSTRQFGYNSVFWYPRYGGIQALPDALSRGLRGLHTDSPVEQVDLRRRRLRVRAGGWERFDVLIATVPLPEWKCLTSLPADVEKSVNALRWTSVSTVNLGVCSAADEKRHWIYFPQADIPFFRAGFYHGFSAHNAPRGAHSLYVETSAPGWRRRLPGKPDVAAMVKSLRRAGCLVAGDRLCEQDIITMPYGYVIYDKNRDAAVKSISDYLARHGVICAGRYGSWQYLSMEGTMMQAFSAVQSIIS